MTVITNDPIGAPVTTTRIRVASVANTFIEWRVHPARAASTRLRSYQDEKDAFVGMLPTLLRQHPGEYVAVADGQIMAHAASRREAARQFFVDGRRGPVYIGFVGARREIRQLSPFRSRNARLS